MNIISHTGCLYTLPLQDTKDASLAADIKFDHFKKLHINLTKGSRNLEPRNFLSVFSQTILLFIPGDGYRSGWINNEIDSLNVCLCNNNVTT